MMRHYYAMLLERREKDCVGKMKQFATYFTHGVRNGAKLRAAIYHAQEARAILDLVDAVLPRTEPVLALGEAGPTDHRRRLPRQSRAGRLGRAFSATTSTRRSCGAPSRTPPTTAWSCARPSKA